MKYRFIALFLLVPALALADAGSCGKKHDNLTRLQSVCAGQEGVHIPSFLGITSTRVEAFLEQQQPEILDQYQKFVQVVSQGTSSVSDYNHMLLLIQDDIKRAFATQSFTFNPEEERFFAQVAATKEFLMVRSTGVEDGQNVANAGGNASIAYVDPSKKAEICSAMAEVVASYFGAQSLKNRIAGGEDLSTTPLCLPVLIQVLIGEGNDGSIPVSGVAYSSNPVLSNDQFNVTEINAAYGHGEGVVANRVQTDRFYLIPSHSNPHEPLILPQVGAKKSRLVPVKNGDSHSLELRANTQVDSIKAALSDAILVRLYRVLQKIEAAYGYAVDVEFVVKNNIIYIVQVRPAMHSVATPSYTSHEEDHPAIVQQFAAIAIVPGSLKAQIIDTAADFLIHKTLDEADQSLQASQTKAVIVGQWASSLSHAAVNFMSHSTPCLFVAEYQALEKYLNDWKSSYRLIIDVQKQTVTIWDTDVCQEYGIQEGWYQLPVSAAFSYPSISIKKSEKQLLPLDAKMLDVCARLVQASSDQAAAILDTLNTIVTKALTMSKNRIALIAPHITNAADYTNLIAAIQDRWGSVYNDYKHGLAHGMDQKHKLFLHAIMRSIINPEDNQTVTGTYRLYDVLNDALVLQMACTYKKKFSNALLAQEFALADQAPCQELEQMWKEYLTAVEAAYQQSPESQTLALITRFKEMVHELHDAGYFALWLVTDFAGEMQTNKSPAVIMQNLCKKHGIHIGILSRTTHAVQNIFFESVPRTEFIKSIKNTQNTLDDIQKCIALCSDLKSWQTLENEFDALLKKTFDEDFASRYRQADLLSKLIAGNMMTSSVEVMDTLIKNMKISKLSSVEKRDNFKLMIERFCWLTEYFLIKIMPKSALKYHYDYPLRTYLDAYKEQWGSLTWNTDSEDVFKKSEYFSVNAAMLGTATNFSRHFPQTAEDCFMLMHQNALVALAGAMHSALNNTASWLYALKKMVADGILTLDQWSPEALQKIVPLKKMIPNSVVNNKVFLPQLVKNVVDMLNSPKMITLFVQANGCSLPQQIGVDYHKDGITITYNVSLRNHSSRLLVMYDKHTNMCRIEMQMVGDSRWRWADVHFFAHLTPGLFNLDLESTNFDKRGGCVITCWRVRTQQDIEKILYCCALMGQLSFEGGLHVNNIQFIAEQTQQPGNILQQLRSTLVILQKSHASAFGSRIDSLGSELQNHIEQERA